MLPSLGRGLMPADADPALLAGSCLLAENGRRLVTQSNIALRRETTPAPPATPVPAPPP